MSYSTPRHRPSLQSLAPSNLRPSPPSLTPQMPRKQDGGGGEDLEVGDVVDVPGGSHGVVKFVGEVRGKQGYFVGIELAKEFADRGKNDGQADGVQYFTTAVKGAGIFLPIHRATKRASPTASDSAHTPLTPNFDVNTFSPPRDATPPKAGPQASNFSASLRGRAPSPAFKPKSSRPSLPRPESPLRKVQAANTPLHSRPSLNALSSNRFTAPSFRASPTPAKMSARQQPTKTPTAVRSTAPSTNGRPGSRASRDVSNTSSVAGITGTVRGRPPSSLSSASRPNHTASPSEPAAQEEEIARLKAALAEKTQRIATLTADFDVHRADFRSTLDTLELASSETERVYEKRVRELVAENESLTAQHKEFEAQIAEMQAFASQVHEFEESVAELEEGLEESRRGEAEAAGEVEFLRGEVERLRTALAHEKEAGERREAEWKRREREWERQRERGGQRERSLNRTVEARSRGSTVTSPMPGVGVPGLMLGPEGRSRTNTIIERKLSRDGLMGSPSVREAPVPEEDLEEEGEEDKLEVGRYSPRPAEGETSKEVNGHAKATEAKDEGKWCALCEQVGHDSISCPLDV